MSEVITIKPNAAVVLEMGEANGLYWLQIVEDGEVIWEQPYRTRAEAEAEMQDFDRQILDGGGMRASIN